MQQESQIREADFGGRRIMVTGGTRAIGEAMVKRLSSGGGKVITTGRSLTPACSPRSEWIARSFHRVEARLRSVHPYFVDPASAHVFRSRSRVRGG